MIWMTSLCLTHFRLKFSLPSRHFIQGAVVVVIVIIRMDSDGWKLQYSLQPLRYMLMRMLNAKLDAKGRLVHLPGYKSAGAVKML